MNVFINVPEKQDISKNEEENNMAVNVIKNEPAPAATDTSSTDPTSKDSTDSISENAGNVKNKIPKAITDALDEERFRLQKIIDEYNGNIQHLQKRISDLHETIDEGKWNIQYLQKRIDDIENFIEQFGGTDND